MGIFGKKSDNNKPQVKEINIITICGNGLGSSLMLAQNIKKLCEESGIENVNVEAKDFSSAKQTNADLYVSVEEFTSQLNVDKSQIITVKNYHKKSDLKETNLLEAINNLRK
ncbi:PTS sugar transporter subunit IIB [Brachyspira intermedia]|uniref:PTS sugar transporter subunit IIB n=1 Tax=Brachyspira intermedia TaxID=84377 RepID=UPI00262F3A31|nr:PTS sugar transporter subunit IIB [uncultured Brachyspira sp.]